MDKKTDIVSRIEIEKLIRVFYEKMLDDELLAPLFLQVAKVDLTHHLPIIYDFWESALFQVGKYKRDLISVHLDLHQLHRLKASHFNRWLKLFNETVDEYFEGEKATQAKERARTIAAVIKAKINNLDRMRLEFNN